ncbi:NADPH-dependent FMN reductase [Streptomyces sp. NBC_01186]|uniref:NADPH-dependent FMN reductase n=1 Tax=unclassified Streptomyces TaxID=2593676 RepID=UPI002DD82A84|nr:MULTISPECIES: NADPH-dependent FMN reductase [unclassified Streptomyces]WSB76131.1 NADPH-dependent FMN reductase [Streptomyces sp. NBC_01775]WSS15595.1 NADPH-dependent FMN reductase [Streptomyces sp. NBC_01186]
MAHVLTLTGSPTPVGRTERLLRHAGGRLERNGAHRVRHLSLRELPPAALLGADRSDPAIAEAVAALAAADAVVIGSPVYKAAYSGLLKVFLDLLPQTALAGKHVLPLLTGGSPAHVLALDYALRPVLTALGSDSVLRGWFVLDEDIAPEPEVTGTGTGTGIRLAPAAADGVERALSQLAEVLTAHPAERTEAVADERTTEAVAAERTAEAVAA